MYRFLVNSWKCHTFDLSPIPVTYAGGARNLDDLARVRSLGRGRVDLTIGSALDIFGGDLPLEEVLKWQKVSSFVSSCMADC